jgi:hypothetical protein
LATRAADAATVRQQTLTKPPGWGRRALLRELGFDPLLDLNLRPGKAAGAGIPISLLHGAFLPYWHGYILRGRCFQRRR